jgi:hypothetical protein
MQSGESLSEVVVQTNFKDSRLLSSSVLLFRQTKLQDNSSINHSKMAGQAAGVQVTGSNGKPEQQLSLQFVEQVLQVVQHKQFM